MAKNPAQRYQTPAEVAAALEPFLRGAAARPAPPLAARRAPRPCCSPAGRRAAAASPSTALETDKGQLVITTVRERRREVVIKRTGKEVRVIDTKSDKSITLWSGEYELELKDAQRGAEAEYRQGDAAAPARRCWRRSRGTPKPAGQAQSRKRRRKSTRCRHSKATKVAQACDFSPTYAPYQRRAMMGQIRFWTFNTGEEEVPRRLTNPGGAFSTSRCPATASNCSRPATDGAVAEHPQLRYGPVHGKVVREFPVPAVGINTVRFSPDGQQR